jgi:hypothetical protein
MPRNAAAPREFPGQQHDVDRARMTHDAPPGLDRRLSTAVAGRVART